MTVKLIILTIFCYINLAHSKPQNQGSVKSFWNNAKPGELLRSLNVIVSNTHGLIQPVQSDQLDIKNVPPKQSSSIIMRLKRKVDESSVESMEEKIPYDYEKSYEEFIKKYFGDSLNDAPSASESDESERHEAEANSGEEVGSSENQEPEKQASKKLTEIEKCRNIMRGQQNCIICENPQNGESSESCSYNEKSKPQSYEFKKHKNLRKYRATPKESKN